MQSWAEQKSWCLSVSCARPYGRVCVPLHKSYGASLVQAQAREKAWGYPSFPWCPGADTTHMPSVAEQLLLFLCAWCAGSECQRRVTLRKGNRWELMLCFPAKYPAKVIWLILSAGMLRALWSSQKYKTKSQWHWKFIRWAVALTSLKVLNLCPFLAIWLRLVFNKIGKPGNLLTYDDCVSELICAIKCSAKLCFVLSLYSAIYWTWTQWNPVNFPH